MYPLLLLFAALAVLLAALVLTYMGLVSTRDRVDQAWKDIDAALKLRASLVPGLITALRAESGQEKELVAGVAAAQADATAATGISRKAAAEEELSKAIKRLLEGADAQTGLAPAEGYEHVRKELAAATDKFEAARRYYNTAVLDHNTRLQLFPSGLFGRLLGFMHRDFFEVEKRPLISPAAEMKG